MVDTLPLALIAVGPTNAILSLGIFRQVQNTVLTDLTESRTFSTVIKITCNQNLCLGIQTRDGIKRLAKAVCALQKHEVCRQRRSRRRHREYHA